jgi:hypothetical protein
LAFSLQTGDEESGGLHLLVAGESDTSGTAVGKEEHEPFTYDVYDKEPPSDASQTGKDDDIPQLLVATGEEDGSGAGMGGSEIEDDEEKVWCEKVLQAGECVVRYDFNPDDERMLMIRNGDVLTVEAEEQGWLFCTNAYGQSGFVSPHYVDEAPL